MSRYHSYLNSAVSIIDNYGGEEPFASFLRKFFAAEKKYGSKDRKQIAHLAYCYFRMGKSLPGIPVAEKIITGYFLCTGQQSDLLHALRPGWNEKSDVTLEEKVEIVGDHFSLEQVFPWREHLSAAIDDIAFARSFFIQPDLFLRARPGMRDRIEQQFAKHAISYQIEGENSIRLANSTRIDEVIQLNREAVVQDLSSQQVGILMKTAFDQVTKNKMPLAVWDCCAASGGKSIMAYDVAPALELTVSDIRDSILVNLKKRFSEAGIKKFQSFVLDLSKENVTIPFGKDDCSLIIADVPCTGSGTWSRTPEQLFYFDEDAISRYAALQKKIVTNAVTALRPGAYLLYITCSVFKKENEEMVEYLCGSSGFTEIEKQLFKGYTNKADTMFAALLQKKE